MHNTLPAYRLKFFELLSEKNDISYVFTDVETSKKVYGEDSNYGVLEQNKINILGRNTFKNLSRIKKIINEKVKYVVLPPMDDFRSLLLAMYAVHVCHRRNVKLAYFWEKWEAPKEYQPLKKRMKNQIQAVIVGTILRNHVDKVIASGTKSVEYFKRLGVDEDRISIAYDASEVKVYNSDFNLRSIDSLSDKKIILYYGRVIERKGLKILIQALAKLKRKDYYLIVCGDGDKKDEYIELAKKFIPDNYKFMGRIPSIESYKYFSQCDLFVLPSYFKDGIVEAWGLTLNEAIQFNKPIISTNAVGAAFDLIVSNKNGVMVRQNNVIELTKAIDKVLDNLASYSNESKKIFKEINYRTMVDNFTKALER